MFWNYLKITTRMMWRQKGHTALNVVGLAVGMAACALIFLYIQDERTYDRFHEKADRIYRVGWGSAHRQSFPLEYSTVQYPLGEALGRDVPEVESVTRLFFFSAMGPSMFGTESTLVKYENKRFYERDIAFADTSIFDVFTLALLHGDPRTALRDPGTVIVTQETARKYFDGADPLGQTIQTDLFGDLVVTGVLADMPENSHMRFDFLASFASAGLQEKHKSWGNWGYHTYIVLQDGVPAEQVGAKLPELFRQYQPTYYAALAVEELATQYPDAYSYPYFLQPLTDIHFRSGLLFEQEPSGNRTFLYLFGGIALCILALACFNFINLTTARSAERAREVGVRKVLGAASRVLVLQFIGDALLVSLLSTGLALGLTALTLPFFSDLTQKAFSWHMILLDPQVLLSFVVFGLAIGLGAGIHPALSQAAFHPVVALKGQHKGSRTGTRLRNGLVVTQFAVTFVLLVSSGVIYLQMQHVQDKELGLDAERIIAIERGHVLRDQRDSFVEAVQQQAGVVAASYAFRIPGRHHEDRSFFKVFGTDDETKQLITTMPVGFNLLETLDVPLVIGRSFSRDFPSDTAAVILNEQAVAHLGLVDPIGTVLESSNRRRSYTVVGVLKDFHVTSLHEPIQPLVFHLHSSPQFVVARVAGENLSAALAQLKATWNVFVPDYPFQYTLLDAEYARHYERERITGQLVGAFTALAIIIACLGLLGLTAFMTTRRIKEVGVRKVLGASVLELVALLARDFLRLVLVACIGAIPIAYIALTSWLDNFAYRVDLTALPFAIAACLVLGVAGMTVSYHALRAAFANPVDALRYE